MRGQGSRGADRCRFFTIKRNWGSKNYQQEWKEMYSKEGGE
jgi:hypothetical protein